MTPPNFWTCCHSREPYRNSKVEMNFQEGQFMYAKRKLVKTVFLRKFLVLIEPFVSFVWFCHRPWLNQSPQEHSNHLSIALSFYRSQNVLCWSKIFVPEQKIVYILWQSQKFCARQKDDLHLVKLVFVPVQIFWASLKIWLHLVPLQKLLCWHKNQFY